MRIKYRLKKLRTSFGNSFVVPTTENNTDCDIIIIAVNNGGGLKPISSCLPHQFYENEVGEILKKYPDTRWITIIPASSKNCLDLFDLTKDKVKRYDNRRNIKKN